MLRYAIGSSSLGRFCVAVGERGIRGIRLGGEDPELVARIQADFPAEHIAPDPAGLAEIVTRVQQQIEAPGTPHDLPVDARGTPFQQRVWRVLCEIPPGQVISYGELARRVGQPRGARAAAQACGANPVSILVPCHRVVRTGGAIGGYGGGIARKRTLLAREGVHIK